MEDEFSLVFVCIAKWASMREDFDRLKVEGIIHNWEASLYCRRAKEKILVSWVPPREVVLKFNVDGVARGKPDPIGIGVVLRNHLGVVLAIFSIKAGRMESNEVEVLAILQALQIISLPLS